VRTAGLGGKPLLLRCASLERMPVVSATAAVRIAEQDACCICNRCYIAHRWQQVSPAALKLPRTWVNVAQINAARVNRAQINVAVRSLATTGR
jgi:hypothetical protein